MNETHGSAMFADDERKWVRDDDGNIMEIPLTRGKVAIVDADDYERLSAYKWQCATNGYATSSAPRNGGNPKSILMHRFIMNTPEGMHTDHINGNKLDNRKSNLRICTITENMRNRKTNGSKGVHYRKDRRVYVAYIQLELNRRKWLGRFISELAAACAYDYAAKEHYGEFARLNHPNGIPLSPDEVEQQRFRGITSSQYKGVHWYKSRNKWTAKITVGRKPIELGYFLDEIEAAKAYNKAAIKYRGNKAKLNIIPEGGT